MRHVKQRMRGLLSCLMALAALLAWMPGEARALGPGYQVTGASFGKGTTFAAHIKFPGNTMYNNGDIYTVTANNRTYTGYMVARDDQKHETNTPFNSDTLDGYSRWVLYNSMPYRSADYVIQKSGVSGLTDIEIYCATLARLAEIQGGPGASGNVDNIGAGGDLNRINALLTYFRNSGQSNVSANIASMTLAYKGNDALVDNAYVGPYEVTGSGIDANEPIALSIAQSGYTFVDSSRVNAITSTRVGQTFYVKVPTGSNGETITVTASASASSFDDVKFVSSNANKPGYMVGMCSLGTNNEMRTDQRAWHRPAASNLQMLRLSYTYNNAYVAGGVFELYAGTTTGRTRPAGMPLATLTTTATGTVQTDYQLTPGADYTIYQASNPPSGYTYSNNLTFKADNNANRINDITILAVPAGASNIRLQLKYLVNNVPLSGEFEVFAGSYAGNDRPSGSPVIAFYANQFSNGAALSDYVLSPNATYTIYQKTPYSGYGRGANVVFNTNNPDATRTVTVVFPKGTVGQEVKLTVKVMNEAKQMLNGSVFEVYEGGNYSLDTSRPGGGLVNPVARFTITSNGTYTSIGNELNSGYRYTIGKTYTLHELTTVSGYNRHDNVRWTPEQPEETITYTKGSGQGVSKDFELRKYVSHVNGVSTGQTGNESVFTEYAVKRGDKVTYSIRLLNRSDITLRATRIIDEIPAGMSFYESDNAGSGWYRSGDKLYFDSAASLSKGMQITYSLVLRVNDNAPMNARLVNCAYIDDLRCDKNYCITPSKPSASIAVCVSDGSYTGQYNYDLALQKWVMKVNDAATGQNGTESNPPAVGVKRGDKITYGVRIINQGKYTAIATRIADSLPNGTTFNASDNTLGAWYYSSNGKLYLDPSIKLRPGEQVVYELTLRVADAAALGNITNAARIVSMANESGIAVDDEDSYLGDDFSANRVVKDNCITENGRQGGDDDSYDIAVICVTDGGSYYGTGDIRVTKFVYSVSGATTGLNGGESAPTVYTVTKNSTVRWGIRIYNAGNGSVKLTQILDTLPTGLAFLSGNAENNGWGINGQVATYIPNVTLEPGQYTTVYLTTKVLSAAGVTLTNNVDVKWNNTNTCASGSINVKNYEEMERTGEGFAALVPVLLGGALLLGGGTTLLVTRRRRVRGKK